MGEQRRLANDDVSPHRALLLELARTVVRGCGGWVKGGEVQIESTGVGRDGGGGGGDDCKRLKVESESPQKNVEHGGGRRHA